MGTDRDWERWGAKSPYFGVLSIPRFNNEQLDASAEHEFFESGEAHVQAIFEAIEHREGKGWRPRLAVDLGCGVGRLALPLAARSEQVVAVDVSPSMLQEVMRNCYRRDVENLRTERSDDSLSRVPVNADLVHSYLVLQHIPTRRGMCLLEQMASRVSDGGYLGFQIYTACNSDKWLRAMVRLRYRVAPLNWLRNLLRRRPIFEQPMQLHVYPLASVLRLLRGHGFSEVEIFLDVEDGGNFESVFLLAKRTGKEASINNRYA